MLLTQTDVITIFQNTLATLRDEERKKKQINKQTNKQRTKETHFHIRLIRSAFI